MTLLSEALNRDEPEDDEAAVGGDPYERDTNAPEEEDLMALLLPQGQLPRCADRFSLLYNAAAIYGWVKQGSPACAAASLAGSWNALMSLGRSAEGALSVDDLLDVLRRNLEHTISRRRDKIDRLLGASFEPIDCALRVRVAAEGKHFGAKQKTGERLTPKQCIRLLREVVLSGASGNTAASEPDAGAAAADESPSELAFRLFGELVLAEDASMAAEEEEEEAEGADAECCNLGPPKGTPRDSSWKWRADVASFYAAVGGLEKLCRPKSSTAFFGNQDLASALRSLSDERTDAACRLLPLAGRAPPKGQAVAEGYVRLSPADGEETAAAQWRALQAHFVLPGRVVRDILVSTCPTLFFGSDASRAGSGRPGTLVCRRCGAFRCCVLC